MCEWLLFRYECRTCGPKILPRSTRQVDRCQGWIKTGQCEEADYCVKVGSGDCPCCGASTWPDRTEARARVDEEKQKGQKAYAGKEHSFRCAASVALNGEVARVKGRSQNGEKYRGPGEAGSQSSSSRSGSSKSSVEQIELWPRR